MITDETKDVAMYIGRFFLDKHKGNYRATEEEIASLRINKIEIETCSMGQKTVVIELSNPGRLIGKFGSQIEELEKYLNLKVKIVETKESIMDFLVPCPDFTCD